MHTSMHIRRISRIFRSHICKIVHKQRSNLHFNQAVSIYSVFTRSKHTTCSAVNKFRFFRFSIRPSGYTKSYAKTFAGGSNMYNVKKIKDDIVWVGGNDRRLALFENVFPIPRGVSYNAYVVLDEKPAE